MQEYKLFEVYQKISLFELILFFHLHMKEAEALREIVPDKAKELEGIAMSYLELLDIRIQLGEKNIWNFSSVEDIIKEALERFVKTRQASPEKVPEDKEDDSQVEPLQ